MKKIYKAQVPIISGWKEISMPIGSKIVHVGVQDDSHITFWFECDPEKQNELRAFSIWATGQQIPKTHSYVGTVMVPHYVLHLYEVIEQKRQIYP